jgi:hypothetical protein
MAAYLGALKLEIDELKQVIDSERELRATPPAPRKDGDAPPTA